MVQNMVTKQSLQQLPRSGKGREALRDKGQFWTPAWVANAMVSYVARGTNLVFDPGVGMGAFYEALKKVAPNTKFFGTDIDKEVLKEGRRAGIFDASCKLEVRDFIANPPTRKFSAIVANPPYIRHHRLSVDTKRMLQRISVRAIGGQIDGRAGLHVYFLMQALTLLEEGGRLAFIIPADTCEGVFSERLWNWISKRFRIDGIITFEPEATPFPGIDTNAVILLIRNEKPVGKMQWARCTEAGTSDLLTFLRSDLRGGEFVGVKVNERDLDEALKTGLSRPPRVHSDAELTLGDFARVVRGVVTGANEFFFLTSGQAKSFGIPDNLLLRAVGRVRDVEGAYLTEETLSKLEQKGRPTHLLFLNGKSRNDLPNTVKRYLSLGESQGLPKRALISTKNPWYKTEERKIPPILFAYLGRRNARFIRNSAGVIPLTGFLCVYPLSDNKSFIEKFWRILQHPITIANLRLVGKSYGSGAIKVEPRSLERLPMDGQLIKQFSLKSLKRKQLALV